MSDPCPFNMTNCGQGGEIACVDLEVDEENCGACGLSCTEDAECLAGVCTAPVHRAEPEEEP